MLCGQRLLEISDPIRTTEMWVLNDRPSIRFVRDALLMRRADTIDLVLSQEAAPPAAVSSPGEPGYSSDSTGNQTWEGELNYT